MTVRIRNAKDGSEPLPGETFESFAEAFYQIHDSSVRSSIADDMADWLAIANINAKWIVESILGDGGDTIVERYILSVESDLADHGCFETADGLFVITKEGDSDE